MKFQEAKDIIRRNAGFRVEFEKQAGGMLVSDHFPDDGEETICTETAAWGYARAFAKVGRNHGIVNVYVIHGDDYTPVEDYVEQKLNVYPNEVGSDIEL